MAGSSMTGGGLVSREDLARIALRYDTSMSRAMLRALGIQAPEPMPSVGTVARADLRYDGIAWCFANHGSPMDVR